MLEGVTWLNQEKYNLLWGDFKFSSIFNKPDPDDVSAVSMFAV